MKASSSVGRVLCVASVVAFTGAGLAVLTGCPGSLPDGGSADTGTLRGIITNSATEAALAGATVALDPAQADVDITADADGAFSQELPIGVYTLTFENSHFDSLTRTVAVNGGQTATVDAALTPTDAVAITVATDGDAVPGGTVTAIATVEILDGATTVQGFAWSQSNSVDATISGETTATASVALPDTAAYKAELIHVLMEPPVTEAQLPPNVPLPEGEFPGGLPDRFQVVGPNPFALEETGLVTLEVAVTTSSGTFTEDVEIHAELPWKPAGGIRNVPLNAAVLLSGKTQDSYNWALSAPAGSAASLVDATTQQPYFTPDVAGAYMVTVTDQTADPAAAVTLEIRGGTWEGAITGQDADGRPLAASCTACHNDTIARDMFTPWAQTGHAEIFTDNLNTSTHYGPSCFPCHTVGYDPAADNGGVDEASDYQAFIDSGLINTPGDNWTTVLADYPETAQLANIQCENCHGPQNGGAHMTGESRISLAAEVCAVCHGEPLRHARYQQWQLSGHANFELAIDEGESGSCSRCHTANGFLAWLPVLLDDDPATDPLDNVEVTWTPDETQPQTCVTCHDPHSIGTTTGAQSNATVRISGNTPPLIAGFTAIGVGRGAICMTCHNSRRGLRNDDTFDAVVASGDASRAPHGSSQTDVLMGQNAFLVEVGVRGSHSFVQDTCVVCHMIETPPPAVLSYNQGGSNHTFFASGDVCANCHGELLTVDSLESAFEATSEELGTLVEAAMLNLFTDITSNGNTIDVNGAAVITDPTLIAEIIFGEARGRQAVTIEFTDGTIVGPTRVNDLAVLDATDMELGDLYDFADARLIKAGWNWNLANNDGSRGVHNPSFVFELLDAAIDALNELASE